MGGRLLSWSAHVPRFSRRDFVDGGDASAELIWPLTYDELVPYYERVERVLRVVGRADRLEEAPDNLGDRRFALLPMATAVRVEVEPSSNQASGVTYFDEAEKTPRFVGARAVVLAAGTLDSTLILFEFELEEIRERARECVRHPGPILDRRRHVDGRVLRRSARAPRSASARLHSAP